MAYSASEFNLYSKVAITLIHVHVDFNQQFREIGVSLYDAARDNGLMAASFDLIDFLVYLEPLRKKNFS